MCKSNLALGVYIGAVLWAFLAGSQISHAQSIPDFSGSWDRIGQHVEMYKEIPGYDGPLLGPHRTPG